MFKFKNKEDKPLSNRELKRLVLENQALLFMKLNKWANTIENTIANMDDILELAKKAQGTSQEDILKAILNKDGE